MQKNKYQRMNKEEQKKLRENFKKSEIGKAKLSRLKRLVYYSIFGIVVTIMIVLNGIFNNGTIWDYIYAGILLIFSTIFAYGAIKLKNKEYNNYAIKNGKK